MRRTIREQDPVKPSTRLRTMLAGDLSITPSVTPPTRPSSSASCAATWTGS